MAPGTRHVFNSAVHCHRWCHNECVYVKVYSACCSRFTAEEFDPDRFIDARLKKYLSPRPFIFLPFNAGPRICLGQQFAYNETSFMLIRLLQSFDDITLALDEQPPASRPPVEWLKAEGDRKKVEKIRPKSHLTLYAEVSGLVSLFFPLLKLLDCRVVCGSE